jgi:hypothetical protein
MHKTKLQIAGIVAIGAVLAGCGSSNKTDYCPAVSAILDASSLVVAKQGTNIDPANVLYSVQIVSVAAPKCDYDKKTKIADTKFTITFRATRSPTGDPAQYEVPYFVGVTEGEDRVLNRQTYTVPFQFAPGQASSTFTDEVNSVVITPDKDKQPYDYQILVGLVITKGQLQYNKTYGLYGQ